jgi:twinkle protein
MGVYSDGHGYCFSCQTYFKTIEQEDNMVVQPFQGNSFDIGHIQEYPIRGFQERLITKEISEAFGVRISYDSDGNIAKHYYPYTKDGDQIVAFKERTVATKAFKVHGKIQGTNLFGQAEFPAGGKRLVITEGELDALAVAQSSKDHYKKIYPVVSIPSASNLKPLLENRDWIRSFGEVVLFFDNDEAGQKAIQQAAKIIGLDRVKIAASNEKDASDILVKHGSKAVMEAVWHATSYSPAGIMVGESLWDAYKEREAVESIPYPDCLDGLNEKLKGMRYGEITLFTSGTGSGKSTVIKEIILDLLTKTTDKIGLISLEESIGDTTQKFIQMVLGGHGICFEDASEQDKRDAFEEFASDERLVLLDHQGSVSDDSLLDKIEYMALMGCKYLVLDHITIAVSEGADGLSGNEAMDKTMSDLLKITKKHNVWLGVISHLRKTTVSGKSFEEGKLASIDDIKGSGSIKQISFDIIAFARNLVADDEAERNTIKFRVLKSRFTGLTGNAGAASYDHRTCRLNSTDFIDYGEDF